MFQLNLPESLKTKEEREKRAKKEQEKDQRTKTKYKNILSGNQESYSMNVEAQLTRVTEILDNQSLNVGKNDSWNKLDKTQRIQKLHSFAEKYGKTNQLPMKEVKSLKLFFSSCLDSGKLSKTKDVNYDKDKGQINSIPALFFNVSNRSFTLKADEKRVSTLKSLTPHRLTAKTDESA
jgi:hypothetical protein